MVEKGIDQLLEAAYKKYCNGEDPCRVSTCPVNVLMLNVNNHLQENNPFLIFGDYQILKDLAQ